MNRGWLILACIQCLQFMAPTSAKSDGLFHQQLKSVRLGNQSYAKKQYADALDLYNQAIAKIHDEPKIHFNRGASLFKLGNYDEAHQALLSATSSEDPEVRKMIFYNLGNVFLAKGDLDKAQLNYRRALEIDPQYDDARFNLEIALKNSLLSTKQSTNGNQEQDPTTSGSNPGNLETPETDSNGNHNPKPSSSSNGSGLQKLDEDDPSNDMSPAQMQNLLNAMRENEKPFQMNRHNRPQAQSKVLEKDW